MWDGLRGVGWAVATNAAADHAFTLHMELGHHIKHIMDRGDVVECFSDARNVVHHRWMEWLGFKKIGETRMGPALLPFFWFERTRSACA
jgi:hypothetical protein